MKHSKFTDSQIMDALKRVEAGGLPLDSGLRRNDVVGSIFVPDQ